MKWFDSCYQAFVSFKCPELIFFAQNRTEFRLQFVIFMTFNTASKILSVKPETLSTLFKSKSLELCIHGDIVVVLLILVLEINGICMRWYYV